ncbi:xanthine dehydrogenase family protein molybdopterin-binding subunit [Burkholderia cenocepacia]|uniref:xanthine dehydrogenase family protein molybdopterin-binding subunit n=1 Tax=Burkholderia cenocepacia TaxID=95486 RepID=UPI001B926FAA|nr:molybdopterin cofactor-binding domain-containing protein [Burkholderia cenocepacia]MBR8102051.1 xanthine dehydrogenase family protein molybdopterin-binding subunit [Burkholderia cenocepacia]MDI9685562.1 molybdopterin-dependent oxidoreductase [Burkholderia cenocepacia]HEP6432361.1 xanthine dehydrogenase family protein molybdopterin-binding subunit [Burkholderia cenocepacia]
MSADPRIARPGRRRFLLGAVGLGGALVVGWGVMPPRSRLGDPAVFPETSGQIALNGWIKITSEGNAILAMPRVEMGQGIHTGLSMLAAEELDIPLTRVSIESSPIERIYGNVVAMGDSSLPLHPDDADKLWARALHWIMAKSAREIGLIITGGSSSMADGWQPVREAAATARATLVEAAAREWGVQSTLVTVREGQLIGPGGKQMPFSAVAQKAREIAPPSNVTLKPASQYQLVGKPAPRNDIAAKTDGSARFAIDVRPPGMLYAAVVMCPIFGGKLKTFNAKAALVMPGVRYVVPFDGSTGGAPGVAVVADHYWQARQSLGALEPEWDNGPHATLDSAGIRQQLVGALDSDKGGFTYRSTGDGLKAFENAQGATIVEAEYSAPYLAHATMEPINCTAQVTKDRVQLWAPTQVATLAQLVAARAAGVSRDQVHIDIPLIGGGFGRRLESDFVGQAVTIAARTAGRPVQVIWSREDDIKHDFYRPQAIARLKARVENGRVTAIASRSAGQSILAGELERLFGAPSLDIDRYTAEGLFDQPYEIEHEHIAHLVVDLPVPIGFWRSVGHSYTGFFLESFLNDVAAAAKLDPLAMRRDLLKAHPRERKVLDIAAQTAGWGQPLAPAADGAPRARGLALHNAFGSVVAQVVEVSLKDGKPRVHRVVCVADCGTVVNPGIVAQQMEGGIIFGLSAALYGQIQIKDGRVIQSNFPDYPVLKMAEAPAIEIHLVPGTAEPTGVGEIAVPPVAPAVAHAVAQLTGKSVRQLPMV